MKKVMIIDDELDILDVLERFLSRTGKIEVETYSNPESALNRLREKQYDLILSDIMMPQVSGMDILKEVKSLNPNSKIVFMTAYSNQDRINTSKKYGVDEYLEKPFENLKMVESKIHSILKI